MLSSCSVSLIFECFPAATDFQMNIGGGIEGCSTINIHEQFFTANFGIKGGILLARSMRVVSGNALPLTVEPEIGT